MTNIDAKLKAKGFALITESKYGVVYVKLEQFGYSEITIYKTDDEVLIESIYSIEHKNGSTERVPYAISCKVLRLIDRKIRELKKKYDWSCEDEDNSGSGEGDTNQQS